MTVLLFVLYVLAHSLEPCKFGSELSSTLSENVLELVTQVVSLQLQRVCQMGNWLQPSGAKFVENDLFALPLPIALVL